MACSMAFVKMNVIEERPNIKESKQSTGLDGEENIVARCEVRGFVKGLAITGIYAPQVEIERITSMCQHVSSWI